MYMYKGEKAMDGVFVKTEPDRDGTDVPITWRAASAWADAEPPYTRNDTPDRRHPRWTVLNQAFGMPKLSPGG